MPSLPLSRRSPRGTVPTVAVLALGLANFVSSTVPATAAGLDTATSPAASSYSRGTVTPQSAAAPKIYIPRDATTIQAVFDTPFVRDLTRRAKVTFIGFYGPLATVTAAGRDGSVAIYYVLPDGASAIEGRAVGTAGRSVVDEQFQAFDALMREIDPQYANAKPGPDRSSSLPASASATPVPMAPAATLQAPGGSVSTGRLAKDAAPAGQVSVPPRESNAKPAGDTAAENAVSDIQKTAWFGIGEANAPVLWFVGDPRCPFCHRLWNNLVPEIRAGSVQVRVVLAPILGAQSWTDTADILNAQDPAARFMAMMMILGQAQPLDRADVVANLKDGIQGDIERNSAFFKRYAATGLLRGTPALLWRDRAGVAHHMAGEPADLKTFISSQLGS